MPAPTTTSDHAVPPDATVFTALSVSPVHAYVLVTATVDAVAV